MGTCYPAWVNDGYRALGFAFDETPDANGLPTQDVFVNWYGQTNARWIYDEDSERFLRYTEGLPHLDAADDSQLWADNLVILEVEHLERPDLFEPGASNASIEIAIYEQGRAYLIRDGMVYQGFWRRRSENPGDAIQLIYGDTVPMKMKPGRTWVSVVRGLGNITLAEQAVDVVGTAESIIASYTPTLTITPTRNSESAN